MSVKKTLSNWLTTKHLLIIRNEENFAEKHTYRFNYARGILVGVSFLLLAILLAIVLVRGILKQHLDPRYSAQEAKRQLIDMKLSMDSLRLELTSRSVYMDNLQRILSGDYELEEIDSLSSTEIRTDVLLEEQLLPIDSQFRAEFENSLISDVTFETGSDFRSIQLFSPLHGIVTSEYDPKDGHFGVDLVGKENEPVQTVADGIIILASWTLDGGHTIGIQHKGGLVSIYKHNSELLKNVGNFVTGGEIVAIIGNSGELTNGPHLHFELWHNASPVNPEEYIGF